MNIFDMDNTLIMTDRLNTLAYNYALARLDLPKITGIKRITKNDIFEKHPRLNPAQKRRLAEYKQRFFEENLNLTTPNRALFNMLNSADSVLWTRANKARARSLLRYYRIEKAFKNIVYSSKKDIPGDVNYLCKICDCAPEDLIFYEDEPEIIKELKSLSLNIVVICD